MVRWLIWLVSRHNQTGSWIDVKKYPARGGDYAKLLHWDLVVNMPNDDPKKRTSGFWEPTQKGIDFAYGRISVPSHVYLFDNEIQAWEDKKVYIEDVVEEDFDFTELMNSTP
jgi:hypothetical protein